MTHSNEGQCLVVKSVLDALRQRAVSQASRTLLSARQLSLDVFQQMLRLSSSREPAELLEHSVKVREMVDRLTQLHSSAAEQLGFLAALVRVGQDVESLEPKERVGP